MNIDILVTEDAKREALYINGQLITEDVFSHSDAINIAELARRGGEDIVAASHWVKNIKQHFPKLLCSIEYETCEDDDETFAYKRKSESSKLSFSCESCNRPIYYSETFYRYFGWIGGKGFNSDICLICKELLEHISDIQRSDDDAPCFCDIISTAFDCEIIYKGKNNRYYWTNFPDDVLFDRTEDGI